MPYQKRRTKRRFYRKGKKRGKIYGAAAAQLWKDVHKLKSMLNVEYKENYASLTSTSVDFAGAITTLNQISQGDADGTRDGDSLKMINLSIRGYTRINGISGDVLSRIIIFLDPQNVITSPNEVLATVGSTLAPLSPKSYDNRFRTKILYDKVFKLDPNYSPQQYFKFALAINKHTQFNAGTTTITSNALKVLLISDVDSAASPKAKTSFTYRLTYVDN